MVSAGGKVDDTNVKELTRLAGEVVDQYILIIKSMESVTLPIFGKKE